MFRTEGTHSPRVTEWILAGYFSYTGVLALFLPLPNPVRWLSVCTSIGALAVLYGFRRRPSRRLFRVLRDVLPLGGVLLAYRQIGWFAQPHADFHLEEAWVRWDRLILTDWGVFDAIESLGPVVPGLLEFLYLLTYAVGPIGLLILFLRGVAERADEFLAFFVASAVAAYALYPYFPSEPPRTVFPGELFGTYDTVFRRFNWWILGGAGIHTSVFPSGHVSAAFGVGFGLLFAMPERRSWGFAMTVVAAGIAVATVYGRYHYAVDAVAGVATSMIASLACACAFRLRRPRAVH